MTDETMPSGLWQETQRAAKAWGAAHRPHGGEPAEPGPAVVGQVLTLPELGVPHVAWAVLRREAGESGRLLLVAADVNPLVGSGDVAVTGSAVGALTLRCRFAAWRASDGLGTATLLGALPPEALSRAEARLQQIEAGGAAGTFSEQETEEDPEYQDWIEGVVQPALGKLEAQAGAAAPSEHPVLPFPVRKPDKLLPSARGAWMRWAAVLAFVGLGTASGFLWWRQAQEIAGLRIATEASDAAHRQAIAELEARRAGLEAQYQERLRAAGEDRARLEAEHRARLEEVEAELAKLRQATDVKNPLLASLEARDVRRGPTRLTVGPEVSHLVLLLPVDDPAGTEFQIDVSDRHSGKQIFVQKGLRADDLGEVRLGLPAVLLPPADYRLRLFRKDGATLHLVREHLIDIEKGAR
jgi:hypothetical protein